MKILLSDHLRCLSPREREQPSLVGERSSALGLVSARRAFLPLPEGPVLRSSPVEHGPVLRTPVGILQAAGRSSTAEGGEGRGEGKERVRDRPRVRLGKEVSSEGLFGFEPLIILSLPF